MMFTHEQLLKAVRKAGRDGQPFTCAAVRECLGVSTRDKKQLSRFHTEFRNLLRVAPEVFEKVGKNSYQLVAAPAVAAAEPVPAALEESVELESVAAEQPAAAEESEAEFELPEPIEETTEIRVLTVEDSAEAAPVLESLDVPLQLIEVDFDVQELQAAEASSETQRVEELIRKDVPQPTAARSWFSFDRSSWLGKRVAGLFGRS